MQPRSRTNILTIRTPEGIEFPLQPAGPVSRCLAWGTDLALIAAAGSALQTILNLLKFVSPDFAGALGILLYFILSIGYGITAEWLWRGQTLGKKLFRLRVMDEQGLHLRFSQVAIRNLLRFADSLPVFYLVGGLACLITRKAQRLGDVAAATVVIRIPKVSEPDMDQIMGNRYNSFRDYPHLSARLRRKISDRESEILLHAVLRRDEMEPVARVELFRMITAHLRNSVSYPREITDGISDEQYVRNVTDLLYRD